MTSLRALSPAGAVAARVGAPLHLVHETRWAEEAAAIQRELERYGALADHVRTTVLLGPTTGSASGPSPWFERDSLLVLACHDPVDSWEALGGVPPSVARACAHALLVGPRCRPDDVDATRPIPCVSEEEPAGPGAGTFDWSQPPRAEEPDVPVLLSLRNDRGDPPWA